MHTFMEILWQAAEQTPPPTQEQVNSGLLYVVLAYGAMWLLIFGYLFTIQRRQSQLKRDIEILKEDEAESGNVPNPEHPVNSGKSGQLG
jgi:CcmD family protein